MKKLRRKNKGSGRSSSGSGRKLLFIIGLAMAGAYWYLQGDEIPAPPPAMTAKPAVPEVREEPVTKPIEYVTESTTPKVQSEEDVRNLRARASQDFEFGLQNLKLKMINGAYQIPLVFRAEKRWCQGGDLDTIDYLRPKPDAPEFLVTIETLVGRKNGDKMRISSKGLFAGFEKTFSVTLRNPSEVLGLFICRDQANAGSCRDKTLKTHDEISNAIADSATMDEARAQDYQLYFQSFFIKDGMLMSYNNTNITSKRGEALKSHLNSQYGMPIPDFNAAWNVNKVLRSVPAKIEENKIFLTLPYNDPRCSPGAPSFEPPKD